MILFYCILFILFEGITEALVKRHSPAVSVIIFRWWIQWLISIALFALWLIIALKFDNYYVPTWKLITGFIFVRFMIFDTIWNITAILAGAKISIWYYGPDDDPKFYDRIMIHLGGWGWFMKGVCGIIGICFLMGWN
jgi:hypothetical protein